MDGGSWAQDVSYVAKQWSEFCAVAAKREEAGREDELFVMRQVGIPGSRVLAVVEPGTRHLSILGVGVHAKIQELHRLALHAFRSGIGEKLFPPLQVRLGGAPARFRFVGRGCIFGFVASGSAPPRFRDPAVVLATLASGFALVGFCNNRAVMIAQGRLSTIAGLDLDRMKIWERLPVAERGAVLLRSSELVYMPAEPSRLGEGRSLSRSRHGLSVLEDPERLEATLSAALQASVIDAIPIGTRGRRDLQGFLVDMARLAMRGEPDITGSPREIAERMGKALGRPARSSRTTYTLLSLLEQHGDSHTRELLVSRPSPHRWTLHLSDLVDSDGTTRRSLFSRWSSLHAVLVGDDTPVSEEEVTNMQIRGGIGGAVVKARHAGAYLFDSAMTEEYELRRERERELLALRARHRERVQALSSELEAVRWQLEQAQAENARRAAQAASADARIERLETQAALALERMGAIFADSQQFERHRALVLSFFDAVRRHDRAAAEAMLAAGFEHRGAHEGGATRCERAEYVRHVETEVAEALKIGAVLAEGDLIAVRIDVRTDEEGPPGPWVQLFRIEDGLIAEAWG